MESRTRRWHARLLVRPPIAAVIFSLAMWSCAPAGSDIAAPTASTTAATSSTSTTIVEVVETPVSLVPDITARPLTTEDLMSMLPIGDTGVAGSPEPVTEVRTNEALLTSASPDPTDEAGDITRFRRINGVVGSYPNSAGVTHVWIDILADAESAHDYFTDAAGDISKGIGGTYDPAATATNVEEFPVDGIGEEALGLVMDVADGTETAIIYRLGRIVVYASVERPGEGRVPAQYLAEEVQDRVLAALVDRDVVTTVETHPDYVFSYELEVTVDDAVYQLQSAGRVVDGDVACSISWSRPDGLIERDLVVIGDRMWSSMPGETLQPVGASLTERSLFAVCPAWPIEIGDAGLADFMTGTPSRHTINGVSAIGYPGSLDALASVVGRPTVDVTADAFSFWVKADASWLIEVNISAEGPTAALGPLIGPSFGISDSAKVVLRHRVSEVGGPLDEVLPPG